MHKKLFISIVIFNLFLGEVYSQTSFASPFSNYMVLQRNSSVSIWGKDTPNTAVTLTTSWNNQSYNVTSDLNGKWKVSVLTPEGSDNEYSLTAKGSSTVIVSNVLIGEVWMCSGQSNMEMTFTWGTANPTEANTIAATASDNKIRGIRLNRLRSLKEEDSFASTWKVLTGNTAKDFSCVAYYYAKALREKLGVPIGVINNSYGGSYIRAWLDRTTASQFSYNTIPDALTTPEYALATVIYNAAVNPWIGFGMKGMIWYQGESDKNYPNRYAEMFPAMINLYRQKWGIGDFPVYFVQVVPYSQWETSSLPFWDMQRKAYYSIKNTGVVVTLDKPSCTEIHPGEKKYIGDRLSYWSLNKTYGFNNIIPSGPLATLAQNNGNIIKVSFDFAETGLVAGTNGLTGFEIAGNDLVYYPATAQINNDNTLSLSSSSVANPQNVRYANGTCANVSASLYNGAGLPASPFIIQNTVVVLPAVEATNSITAPKAITQDQTVTVQVKYDATQRRDIVVYLQEDGNGYTSYGMGRETVNAGSGTVSINVKVNPSTPVTTNGKPIYRFATFITTVGGGWAQRVESGDGNVSTGVTVSVRTTLADDIKTITGPTSVAQGAVAKVLINYEATDNRDIIILLQDASTFVSYATATVNVTPGSGIIEATMNVNTQTPTGNMIYRWSAFMTVVGGNYANRKDEMAQTGISVTQGNYASVQNVRLSPLNVYPMPVSQILNIELPSVGHLLLTSLDGKIIFEKTNEKIGLQSINVEKLLSGIYVLHFFSNAGNYTLKIIKK